MYRLPGYYELPVSSRLIKWATDITSSPGFESDLSDSFRDKLGRDGRRVAFLTLDDLVAWQPAGRFAAGSNMNALRQFMIDWLCHMGVLKVRPAVIGYSSDPRMTLDESLNYMIQAETKLPSMATFGGAEHFNIEALRGAVARVIREVAYLSAQKPALLGRLRVKMSAIAHAIMTGRPLTQEEKSFFVMHHANKDIGDVTAVENADPLVDEAWKRLCDAAESGPFLQFAQGWSNMSQENLMYFWGIYPSSCGFEQGTMRSYGTSFFSPVVEAAFNFTTPFTEYLASVYERGANLEPVAGLEGSTRFRAVTRLGRAPQLWDLPEVDIRINIGEGGILRNVAFDFWSKSRERRVTSDDPSMATPEDLTREIALGSRSWGSQRYGATSLSKWSLIDMDSSPFRKQGKDLVNINPKSLECKLYLPGAAGALAPSGSYREQTVDMSELFDGRGTTVMMPAFCEHVRFPLSSLGRPDAKLEAIVQRKLGLSSPQMIQHVESLRICLNHWWLGLFFGEASLPVTAADLPAYATARRGNNPLPPV